jgi:ABC-type phosphate transport system permease subunit
LLFIIALYDLKEYALHLTATIALLLLSGIGQWVLGYDLLAALQYGLLFFFLFLIIYFLAKLYVSRKYQQKAEGF